MPELTEEQIRKVIATLEHVVTMRDLQKKYFKDRLQGDLQRCKQYERQVDVEAVALLKVLKKETHVEQGQLL